MLTGESLKRRLLESGACSSDEICGCSEKEFHEIEMKAYGPLPKAYKEVMLVIGKGAGEFISDVDMFYPDVITLTEETREYLLDYEVELPEDAFVFADRDGEQILFFRLQQSTEDRPVYKWSNEDPEEFKIVLPSIWNFIEEELSTYAEC
jgi:hypothetical protein